jgi:hypothetical protein
MLMKLSFSHWGVTYYTSRGTLRSAMPSERSTGDPKEGWMPRTLFCEPALYWACGNTVPEPQPWVEPAQATTVTRAVLLYRLDIVEPALPYVQQVGMRKVNLTTYMKNLEKKTKAIQDIIARQQTSITLSPDGSNLGSFDHLTLPPASRVHDELSQSRMGPSPL